MSLLLWLLLLALAGYMGLCALLFVQQRQLLYHPGIERLDPAHLDPAHLDPAHLGGARGGLRLIETVTSDGLTLQHLWLPPQEAAGARVLVAFHGNAGNAGDRAAKLLGALPAGQGLLLAEYRGFAGNPGSPTEGGLLADGASVLGWLEAHGIGPERWVLYGESLGSGVATRLAAEQARAGRPAAGLVLEAPFTSVARAAQHHYWYVPARLLVRDRFDSLAHIAAVGAPLLILHGQGDTVVPHAMGRRLLEAAAEPKRLLSVAQGGHADLFEFPEVPRALAAFLAGG